MYNVILSKVTDVIQNISVEYYRNKRNTIGQNEIATIDVFD